MSFDLMCFLQCHVFRRFSISLRTMTPFLAVGAFSFTRNLLYRKRPADHKINFDDTHFRHACNKHCRLCKNVFQMCRIYIISHVEKLRPSTLVAVLVVAMQGRMLLEHEFIWHDVAFTFLQFVIATDNCE